MKDTYPDFWGNSKTTLTGFWPLPLVDNFTICIRLHWGCNSVGSHASVWGKRTLITGSVGGAVVGPPTCKMGTFFHIPWNDFYCNTQSLGVSPEALFNWKLLLIGIVSAKGIWKHVPILQVGGPAPAPHTLHIIRVLLPHTEAYDPTLLQHHYML